MAMPPRRLRMARPLRELSRFRHSSITAPSSPQMKKYIAVLPASEIGPMVSGRNAGKPAVAPERIDVSEQEIDGNAPGDRAQRQEVAAEPQGRGAENGGDEPGESQRQQQPDPGRAAVHGRVPGGGVGADADEGRLAERREPADAGEQHQAERGEAHRCRCSSSA